MSVYLPPFLDRRLDELRVRGLGPGMTPRGAATTVLEAIAFYAAWCKAHPGQSPEAVLAEWRRREAGR